MNKVNLVLRRRCLGVSISSNLAGQKILGYHVDEFIGSGGFGTVYKVSKTNESGHYESALKHIVIPNEAQYHDVLNSMGGDHSKAENYFKSVLQEIIDEINILRSLSEKNNNHIVTYYDNEVEKQDVPLRYDIFIRMEYVTPLANYLKENKFTVENVIDLGLDILSALELCHTNGIIHRDIKDENIFVNKERVFKVGDFGIAKLLKNTSRAASMKGTPAFIAPEILALEEYDHTVDIYSLGTLLYKLLNYARLPFLPPYPESYQMSDIDHAIEKRQKGAIPDRPLNAPAKLGDAVVKACSPRENRFSSAKKFSDALFEVKQGLSYEELHKVVLGPAAARQSKESSSNLTIDNHYSNSHSRFLSYDETVGTDYSNTSNRLKQNEQKTNKNDQHGNLFETIPSDRTMQSEDPISITPPNSEMGNDHRRNTLEHDNSQRRESDEYTAPSVKKDFSWLVYLSPVIIAIISIIYYMNMFSFLEDIPLVRIILSKGIITLVLSISFIVSLFFVGKKLQGRREESSPFAELKDKEPYYKVSEILSLLKQVMDREKEDKDRYRQVWQRIKQLKEQLEIEPDFGYGKRHIIQIENEITSILYHIKGLIEGLKNRNTGQLNKINHLLSDINELLRRRREMIKR